MFSIREENDLGDIAIGHGMLAITPPCVVILFSIKDKTTREKL